MAKGSFFELNEMKFQLDWNWLKMPKRLPSMQVAGVACDKQDNLYVLTRNHEHPIMLFDSNGQYVKTIGADLDFANEHGIYVGQDGNLWVCDSANHIVYKLNPDGKVLLCLGTRGKPCDNGFNPEVPYPHNLYTVCRAGEPFNLPTGAMEAKDGSIWVTDGYGNASLHHFSKDGKLLRTVGGPGNKPGEFRLPHSLWIDNDNRIWVADRDNYRVEVFDAQGDFLKCFDPIYPIGIPYGLSTLWGNDKYVFCSQDSRGIVVYDIATLTFVGFIEAPNGSPILGHSLCGDSNGSLYIGNIHPEPMVAKLIRIR